MEELRRLIVDNLVLALVVVSMLWLVVGIVLGGLLPRRQKAAKASVRDNSDGRGERQPSQYELYVGNLPYEMSDADLKKLIDPFGEVVSARIITNRISGSSKGYGFVKMSSAEDVRKTVSSLNNKDLDGRRIAVSEARTHPRGRKG
jgi:RNA recognition motif-containing protein